MTTEPRVPRRRSLERLAEAGLIQRTDGNVYSTARWRSVRHAADAQLDAAKPDGHDPGLAVVLALVELVPRATEAELVGMADVLLELGS